VPSRIPTPRWCTGEAPSVLRVSKPARVFHVEQNMGAGTHLLRLTILSDPRSRTPKTGTIFWGRSRAFSEKPTPVE
jgi:hypothetical protein